jgi:predicted RNA-binding Zn ribbon-like protein
VARPFPPSQDVLFEVPGTAAAAPEDRVGRRRSRYRHVHTAAELAAFDRSRAILDAIRGVGLAESERLCPGGCGKVIRRESRSRGRRWCDAVRPSWARSSTVP